MKEVWVAILEDRHCDTGVEVFESEKDALAFAEEHARKYARHSEDLSMEEIAGHGVVWTYSCEGDNVRVTKRIPVNRGGKP